MNKRLLIITSIIFIFSSCSHEHIPTHFDSVGLTGPITVKQDTTLLLVQDYFPLEENIESVEANGFEIKFKKGSDSVYIIRTDSSKTLSSLIVKTRGEKASIAILNRKFIEQNPKLFIYSTTTKKDIVQINTTGGIKEYIVLWQNSDISKNAVFEEFDSLNGMLKIEIPYCANDYEKSYIRVYSAADSSLSNDLLIPLLNGKVITTSNKLTRKDKYNQVMYSLMIDRFYDGDTSNTKKLNTSEVLPKVDYYGGDLAGVLEKLKSGYFDQLGINTLWLSPVIQNPKDAWGQIDNPKTRFSGYHGYWPYFITKIDTRFGNDNLLREIIKEAHSKDINVLLDYVSNHMFINSPTLIAHPDWVTSNVTPDGRPNYQLWDEFRLTTWFDKHIPSLDLEKKYVYEPMTDSALVWLDKFDIDGYRHDATKHVPEVFWRTLTKKILKKYPKRDFYQIGETYGSPELISSYVKKGMLDAQFDFNIYDNFIYSIVDKEGSFINLTNTLNQSFQTYGFHNLMGVISGNQDRPRFISLAGGALSKDEDTKLAGWKRDIGVGDEIGYNRMEMLNAFMMTIPGIPCIFYGDEYGQPGANDPDNRRWMRFEGYSEKENILKDEIKKLINLRKSSLPMIFGDFHLLYSDKDAFAYSRLYMGEVAICAFNKKSNNVILKLELPVNLIKDNLTEFKGNLINVEGKTIEINIPQNSYTIIQGKF